MTLDELRVAAIVIASIALVWWIIRDSRPHERPTVEQEQDAGIEAESYAPQHRRKRRME